MNEFIFTCFDCPTNKISCKSNKLPLTTNILCKELVNNECNGCKVCGTNSYEQCIHCNIDCDFETSCQFRNEWMTVSKEENMKLKIIKAKDNKTQNKHEENTTTVFTRPKVWGDTGLKCITECPHKVKGKTILLYPIVISKLRYLQTKFSNTEFLVAGTAEELTEDTYILTDVVFPKQERGYASVDNIEYDKAYNLVIHKHPGKNPGGFSGGDEDTINGNHDFSIVIGSDSIVDAKGVCRVKVECGHYMTTDLKVMIALPDISHDKAFIDSVNNNSTEKNYIHNTSTSYQPTWKKYNDTLDKYRKNWDNSYGYFG